MQNLLNALKSVGFTLERALQYMVNHFRKKLNLFELKGVFINFQTLEREIY
jgi:hypothetical protein